MWGIKEKEKWRLSGLRHGEMVQPLPEMGRLEKVRERSGVRL